MQLIRFLGFRLGIIFFSIFLLASCESSSSGVTPTPTPTTYSVTFLNSDGTTANDSTHRQALSASVNATDSETFTIENGSSSTAALSGFSASTTLTGVTVTFGDGCSSVAVGGSCTGTIVFAPTIPIVDTNGIVTITYNTNQTATFYASISNGNNIQAIMVGQSSDSSGKFKKLGATTTVPEKAFDVSSDVFTATALSNDADQPVARISKIVGTLLPDGLATKLYQWAYAKKDATDYDGFFYDSASAGWQTGTAFSAGFVPIDLYISHGATGDDYAAVLVGKNGNKLAVYRSIGSSWGDDISPDTTTNFASDETFEVKGSKGNLDILASGSSGYYIYYGNYDDPSNWLTKNLSTLISPTTVTSATFEAAANTVAVILNESKLFYTLNGTDWSESATTSGYIPIEIIKGAKEGVLMSIWRNESTRGYAEADIQNGTVGATDAPNITNLTLAAGAPSSTVPTIMLVGTGSDGDLYTDRCTAGSDGEFVSVSNLGGIQSISKIVGAAGTTGNAGTFLFLGINNSGHPVIGYVGTEDSSPAWTVQDMTDKGFAIVNDVIADINSDISYVVGMNSSGESVYSTITTPGGATPTSFSSATTFTAPFMWKSDSLFDASTLSDAGGNLLGIQQSRLAQVFSIYQGGAWSTSPTALDSLFGGDTLDNIGWDPAATFAASLESCATGICNEDIWYLVTSGSAHKTAHFVNSTATPASLQTVSGMSDISRIYSSAGHAIAMQIAPGALSVSYYNNDATPPAWGTATNLTSSGGYITSSKNTLVASSDGDFWVAYPTSSDASTYSIAHVDTTGTWTTAAEPLSSVGTNQRYLVSAGGKAWEVATTDSGIVLGYFDSSWSSTTIGTSSDSVTTVAASTDSSGTPTLFVTAFDSTAGAYFVDEIQGTTVKTAGTDFGTNISAAAGDTLSLFTSSGKAWFLGVDSSTTPANAAVVSYFNGSTWATPVQLLSGDITTVTNAYTANGKIWIVGTASDGTTYHIAYFDGSNWSQQDITGMSTISAILPLGANLIATGTNTDSARVFSIYDSTTNSWGAVQTYSSLGLSNATMYAQTVAPVQVAN